ncbi:unnamed protein product [Musa banksii]
MRRCYLPHEVSYADVRSWDLPSLPHTYIQYTKIRVASDTVRVVLPLFPSPRPPPSRYQHTSL